MSKKIIIIGLIILVVIGVYTSGIIGNTTHEQIIYTDHNTTIFANLTDNYQLSKTLDNCYVADKDPNYAREIFVINKTDANEKMLVDTLKSGSKVQKNVWKVGTVEKLVNSYDGLGTHVKIDYQNVYVGFVEVDNFLVIFMGKDCELEAQRVLESVTIYKE